MRMTILTSLLLAALTTTVLAQQCAPALPPLAKPLLPGEVWDGANGIKFNWVSKAWPEGGAWRVMHVVCNMGEPLVLTWEKTGIIFTGFGPLARDKTFFVSYTLPTEPQTDTSPIFYTYARQVAQASSYQAQVGPDKPTRLSSNVYGYVAKGEVGSFESDPPLREVNIVFDVEKVDGGYSLWVGIKSDLTGTLVGFASQQNGQLQEAFNKAGMRTQYIDWRYPARELEEAGKALIHPGPFIAVPVADLGSRRVLVPSGNDIEVARVAVFNSNRVPIASAAVSLFK